MAKLFFPLSQFFLLVAVSVEEEIQKGAESDYMYIGVLLMRSALLDLFICIPGSCREGMRVVVHSR